MPVAVSERFWAIHANIGLIWIEDLISVFESLILPYKCQGYFEKHILWQIP